MSGLSALRLLLTLASLALAAPVLAVLASWLGFDAAARDVLAHLAGTVLPDYALQSAVLALGVAAGVALLGVGSAVAVALFRFPGRGVFEWALLLPMAMPAYVLAYAATDALQFSGPLQTALRSAFGWRGALWPDVRSLGGAIVLFVLCLYPYVYLLTRVALGERAVQLMEAARLLGASPRRRVLAVALPLARPAVVAGVALALMETLADYGVGAYFGLSTFTTGIYRAWLSMNDPMAAAQLASMLLGLVALLLVLERRAQSRLRFAASRAPAGAAESQPLVLSGRRAALAWLVCALPVAAGFVAPVAWLAAMAWREWSAAEVALPWHRFGQWASASFWLAGAAAAIATTLALALGFARRLQARQGGLGGLGGLDGALDHAVALGARALSLGYAVPGAVLAIGILVPLGWAQQRWPEAGLAALFTGTSTGLMVAYLVRFSAVAMQSVDAGYARVPPSVDETARMLGAGPARVFARLHLPLLRRPALGAALLVFVDAMKELPATLVLRPFGMDTLAVSAYQLARDERLAEAAVPSLAIVAVGLLPVILLSRAMRNSGS